jgi:signal transduction histidine kinase
LTHPGGSPLGLATRSAKLMTSITYKFKIVKSRIGTFVPGLAVVTLEYIGRLGIRWDRVSWLIVPAMLGVIEILIATIGYPVNFALAYVALVIAVYLGGFGPGILGLVLVWGYIFYQIGIVNDPGRFLVSTISTGTIVLFTGLAHRGDKRYKAIQKARVEELNQELALANAELQRKIKDQYHLLRACAHDLRAPLRSIAGFIDEMAAENRLVQEYMDFVRAGVRRMTTLIDDLSLLARLETEQLPSGPVDLTRLFREELEIFRDAIEEKGAVVTVGKMPRIQGVYTRLAQLFQNLLDNALKFGATEIEIGATYAGGEVIISIRDNGIGIDPKYYIKIFEQFERLNRQEDYPGTGMGLTIVQRIAAQHGGRVWLESKPGQGTTFYVALPYEKAR